MAGLSRSVEKELFWRRAVQEHHDSGLSAAQFCHRAGLSVPLFYYWRQELKRRDQQGPSRHVTQAMVPVRVVSSEALPASTAVAPQRLALRPPALADDSSHPVVEVSTPGGFTFRATASIEPELITNWLAAVKRIEGDASHD